MGAHMPPALAVPGPLSRTGPKLIPGSPYPDYPWSPKSPLTLCQESASSDGLDTDGNGDVSDKWSTARSASLYNVKGWGDPYFSVGPEGTLCVHPQGDGAASIDLHDLVTSLREQGCMTPCLFRFTDIVGHRLAALQGCFMAAISKYGYKGTYQGVFPVKCNPDKHLIASVLEHGAQHRFGLEAGSKAELLLAASMLSAQPPGALLVCNGYKDAAYMELALHCQQLGIRVVLVLEQYSELAMILSTAAHMGMRPMVGVRAKLTTRHGGHWGSTSGDRAKFGLRTSEIVAVVETLAAHGMLDCLQLLHFHAGSQITNIRVVKEAMQEAAFFFAELVQLGAHMTMLDVGGGLAIDYDGSRTDSAASCSYTMQQYANDIVASVQEVCLLRNIPMPTLISESGRALASHHAVLVFEVLPRAMPGPVPLLQQEAGLPVIPGSTSGRGLRVCSSLKGHHLLRAFQEVLDSLTAMPTSPMLLEAYADAAYFKEEALRAFKLGVLSLQERAQVDVLFDATCDRICALATSAALPLPEQLQPETRPHASIYHVNLSVFRSAPDVWAIQQVFPIMPIHRLDASPTESATLADITCDSDGRIDHFVSAEGGRPMPVLQLHPMLPGRPYYLALFHGGVYQEVMGSSHNMLGSTNTVHVRLDTAAAHCPHEGRHTGPGAVSSSPDGVLRGNGFVVERIMSGENMQQVLARTNYQGKEMLKIIDEAAARAVAAGKLADVQVKALMDCFGAFLASYTYLRCS